MVDKDQIYILSLPPELIEKVNTEGDTFLSDVRFNSNGRQAHFRVDDLVYRAKLKDNPTILESMVSSDGETWFKSGDISQILKVYEKPFNINSMNQMEIDQDLETEWEESEEEIQARIWNELMYLPYDIDYNKYENLSGITPPTIMQKPFRFDSLPLRPRYAPDIPKKNLKAKYEIKLEENNEKMAKITQDKNKKVKVENAALKKQKLSEINRKYFMDFYIDSMDKIILPETLLKSAKRMNIDIVSLLNNKDEEIIEYDTKLNQDQQEKTLPKVPIPQNNININDKRNTSLYINIENNIIDNDTINGVNSFNSQADTMLGNASGNFDPMGDRRSQRSVSQSSQMSQNKNLSRAPIFELNIPSYRTQFMTEKPGTTLLSSANPSHTTSGAVSGFGSGVASPNVEYANMASVEKTFNPLSPENFNAPIISQTNDSQLLNIGISQPPPVPRSDQPSPTPLSPAFVKSTPMVISQQMTQQEPQEPQSIDAKEGQIELLRSKISELTNKIEYEREKKYSKVALKKRSEENIRTWENERMEYQGRLDKLLSG